MPSKILIVDDDPSIAGNLEALLTSKGHETVCVADGESAIAKARDEQPDLILLDVMLPKVGGFDVCRLLKADPLTQKIKIVMITALGRIADVQTAFKNGADDYLIKPFDSRRLFEKIQKVLQG